MNQIRPTITVAIPSYNKEKYIVRCIEGILTNKEFIDEIILVDNCSTDKTFNLAKKYEPMIKCYQNQHNIGMSRNWNRCIDLCKTDWLMIFHADDEMLPDSIIKYLEFIKKYPNVGFIHAAAYTILEGDTASKQLSQSDNQEIREAGLDALGRPGNICSTVMVKKNAYNELGYFIESSLASDQEMWLRIGTKFDTGYINSPTVIYHINPSSTGYDSLINRSIREIRADWDLLGESVASFYPTEELREEYRRKTIKSAPYGYWAVLTANLRARNYIKAFQAAGLMVFVYRGFIPFVQLSVGYIKKKINKKLHLTPNDTL